MAVNRKLNVISVEASGDLSSNQYRIVHANTSGQLAVTTDSTSQVPLGVLLNKPAAAGRAGRVAVAGSVVKLEAGAAINESEPVTAVAGGRGSALAGVAASGTGFIVGFALTAASGSGALFECVVNPMHYEKA